MFNTWVKFYLALAAIMIVSVFTWEYYHMRPCSALYGVRSGDSVETTIERTDQFLDCSAGNRVLIFGGQFVAILLIPVVALLAWACTAFTDWVWRVRARRYYEAHRDYMGFR